MIYRVAAAIGWGIFKESFWSTEELAREQHEKLKQEVIDEREGFAAEAEEEDNRYSHAPENALTKADLIFEEFVNNPSAYEWQEEIVSVYIEPIELDSPESGDK